MKVLDFGASRDGVKPENLGRRIVVDVDGNETIESPSDLEDNIIAEDMTMG